MRNAPAIIGNSLIRVGVANTFELDDYNDLNAFLLGNIDESGNFHIADNLTYLEYFNPVLPNAFNIVVFKQGKFVIRAVFYKNGKYVNVDFPITVQTEYFMQTGNYYGAGIYPIYAYQHDRNMDIMQIFWDRKYIPHSKSYSLLGNEYRFMAYTLDLPSDHPYYNKMRTVFKHEYHGLTAYSLGNLYDIDKRTLLNNVGTPVFNILKEQVPGSVPLYSINLTVINYNQVITQCRYMSLIDYSDNFTYRNPDGSISRVINMGLLGYVFPVSE